jgi:hypothetical protein
MVPPVPDTFSHLKHESCGKERSFLAEDFVENSVLESCAKESSLLAVIVLCSSSSSSAPTVNSLRREGHWLEDVILSLEQYWYGALQVPE